MTIYISGNSHVGALRMGMRHIGDWGLENPCIFPLGSGAFEVKPFSERRGNCVVPLVEQYAANLRNFTGRTEITGAAIWGFCNVNHNSRIWRHPMWRRYEPALIAKSNRHPVSDAAVNAIIARDIVYVQQFLEQVKSCGITVFAISAPFPREDHKSIESGTRKDVVLHIDRTARQCWERWLADRNIPYIAPPAESRTDAGFLRAKFRAAKDTNHANDRYGHLMMQKVLELAQSRNWLDLPVPPSAS